jgi:hypothetical protein
LIGASELPTSVLASSLQGVESMKNRSLPTPPHHQSISLDHEEIAVFAHHLFVERGAEHGKDWEDWFRAERLLRECRANHLPKPDPAPDAASMAATSRTSRPEKENSRPIRTRVEPGLAILTAQ